MIWSIIRYIRGYLLIRVEGYSPERFLNACSHRGIDLWNLKSAEGAYEMYITLKDFRKIKTISKKTVTKVRVKRRCGLPFFLHRYRRRKVFFAGAVLAAGIVYGLSFFIWEIDIRGNSRRTDEALLDFLKTTDVYCGMSAGKVDCERIAGDIRRRYGDIVWVSASVHGTKLVIQVKENSLTDEPQETSGRQGTDLAAQRDCTIVSIVTRQGTPEVHVGDQVKKGDILVNGRIDMKNDAGEVTGYSYCGAEADIVGEYQISYEDTMEKSHEIRQYIYERNNQQKQEEIFVRLGEWTVSLGQIKNNYENYEYYFTEKQLRIGKNFLLPVFWGEKTAVPYTAQEAFYTDEQMQVYLSRRFELACRDMEKKGLEIMQNDVKIYTEQNETSARGTLTVRGSVAEEVPTEILPEPRTDERTEREDQNGNE